MPGVLSFRVAPDAYHHARHAHDMLSVICVTQGAKSFENQRRTCTVGAGEVAIANPGEIHGCDAQEAKPWSHQTCYLSPALLARVAEDLGYDRAPEIATHHITSSALASAILAGHRAQEGDSPLDQDSTLLSALSLLLTQHGGARTPPGRVHRSGCRHPHGALSQDDPR